MWYVLMNSYYDKNNPTTGEIFLMHNFGNAPGIYTQLQISISKSDEINPQKKWHRHDLHWGMTHLTSLHHLLSDSTCYKNNSNANYYRIKNYLKTLVQRSTIRLDNTSSKYKYPHYNMGLGSTYCVCDFRHQVYNWW